jgi:hypothetical protein
MKVTVWSNGGTGYGLKVGEGDRDRFFDPSWRSVVLELAGQGDVVASVSPSFWRACRELRSAEIGQWLQRHGLASWPSGKPPKILMEHVAGNRFAVKLPAGRESGLGSEESDNPAVRFRIRSIRPWVH